jgi:hypothetical protein
MKLCTKCKQREREILNYCKICLSLKNRVYYAEHRQKRINDIKKRQKETNYKSDKRPIRRIKQRIRARARIYLSLNNHVCDICQINKAKERHHKDYNKPLEVLFLCKNCHLKEHLKGGKNKDR